MHDESGRRQMVNELKKLLLTTDNTSEENVSVAMNAFMATYSNKQDFMRLMVEVCSELREPIEEFGVENMIKANDGYADAASAKDNDGEPIGAPVLSLSEVWAMQQQLHYLRWREEEKDEVMEHEEEIEELEQTLEKCPQVLRLQMLWVRSLSIVAFLFEHSRSILPELETLYTTCVLPGLQQV